MQDTPDKPTEQKLPAKTQDIRAKLRADRLKAALKSNMARRKTQAKTRSVAQADNEKEDE